MSMRTLLLVGAGVGVCYLAGVPVVDWVLSLFQVLFHVVSALLWAFWQLLQPAQDQRHSSLPELHQAVLNVTSDASRVADLLDEFMTQYAPDPQLKAKFLSFMASQADTKYSVVDNKLNWVLWMYSLIWMPLLVLMCLTRMGRGSPASSSAKAPAADGRHLPAGSVLQHQQQAAGLAGYGSLHPAGSGGSQFLDQPASAFSSSSTAAAAARRRTATATASLDLPPRYSVPGSFGRGGYADDGDGSSSMRSAASGRSLRQALNSGLVRGPAAAPPRASSDRLHMSRPSKLLQGAASLPPQAALNSSGSSARAGFSRQKTMPMPNRAAQGLNARLSYTGGEYGSGSPRGFDVQAADQQAAAGLVANSSSSASSQQVYLLMRKGQGQQVLQQGPADVHFVHDDDAAAAADALAA